MLLQCQKTRLLWRLQTSATLCCSSWRCASTLSSKALPSACQVRPLFRTSHLNFLNHAQYMLPSQVIPFMVWVRVHILVSLVLSMRLINFSVVLYLFSNVNRYMEGPLDHLPAQALRGGSYGYCAAAYAAQPAAAAVLPVRVRFRHLHARGCGHRHHHRLHHGGQHRRLDLRHIHEYRHRRVRVCSHQPPARQGLQARQQGGPQPPLLALAGRCHGRCSPRHRHDLGLTTCTSVTRAISFTISLPPFPFPGESRVCKSVISCP